MTGYDKAERREDLADWVEFLTSKYVDVFSSDYCGQWLQGIEHDEALGWLAWEELDEYADPPHPEIALDAWRNGLKLPTGYYRLNTRLAIKAYNIGQREHGADYWCCAGTRDALDEDSAIQMALLGEVRYA